MIHGIASDSTTYNSLLEVIEQRRDLDDCRIVTFDLLGSGKSASGDNLEYTYEEQIEALHNALVSLKIDSPLILVGHSLGTFIVTKYADIFPNEVKKLILISAPVYTPDDLTSPLFALGIEAFKNSVAERKPEVLEQKAFHNSMKNIVTNPDNYDTLLRVKTPTVIIYGDEDALIASDNYPELLEANSSISAVMVHGKHGISSDKFDVFFDILRKELEEQK